jgi:hypothetical protein
VRPEEKQLLFPDREEVHAVEIHSLDQMLEKFTLEAIFKKEITKASGTRDITNLFMTIFLGSVVSAHVNQISPIKFFFRKNIDLVMKGL